VKDVNPHAGWPIWADTRHTSFSVTRRLAHGGGPDSVPAEDLQDWSNHYVGESKGKVPVYTLFSDEDEEHNP